MPHTARIIIGNHDPITRNTRVRFVIIGATIDNRLVLNRVTVVCSSTRNGFAASATEYICAAAPSAQRAMTQADDELNDLLCTLTSVAQEAPVNKVLQSFHAVLKMATCQEAVLDQYGHPVENLFTTMISVRDTADPRAGNAMRAQPSRSTAPRTKWSRAYKLQEAGAFSPNCIKDWVNCWRNVLPRVVCFILDKHVLHLEHYPHRPDDESWPREFGNASFAPMAAAMAELAGTASRLSQKTVTARAYMNFVFRHFGALVVAMDDARTEKAKVLLRMVENAQAWKKLLTQVTDNAKAIQVAVDQMVDYYESRTAPPTDPEAGWFFCTGAIQSTYSLTLVVPSGSAKGYEGWLARFNQYKMDHQSSAPIQGRDGTM